MESAPGLDSSIRPLPRKDSAGVKVRPSTAAAYWQNGQVDPSIDNFLFSRAGRGFTRSFEWSILLSHRQSSGENGMESGKRGPAAGEMLQGTLDMLILRTLVMGPAHGHTIAQVIEHTSEQALEVEQGSLYPALHRLEDRGLVSAKWGVSENNRRAKFYQLTAAGKRKLAAETSRWRRMTRAIGLVLDEPITRDANE
jgi:transcriptional regulator